MSLVPFDDRDGFIWMDGQFVPWREAKVHVICHGLHYGSAVFEGERSYNGTIFKSREHSLRLLESARLIGMTIPYTAEQICAAKIETLTKSGLQNPYLRPVAWRGSEQMGIGARQAKTHLAIAVWDWPSYFSPELLEKGITLMTAKWKKPSPETAPCTSKAAGLYMINTLSKHAAEEAGYHDALMYDYRGYAVEATGANLFRVKDNVIRTPKPDCFLNGITRLTVIDLAKEAGYKVEEDHITTEDLFSSDEIFITGTAAEVMPIAKIDQTDFQSGPVTKRLQQLYQELVNR
jgi:branched-chain amino acid aminotransferase